MTRKRYLGNSDENNMKVHDLDNEQTNCQIAEIKRRVEFDTLQEAKNAGYEPCEWCLPESAQ